MFRCNIPEGVEVKISAEIIRPLLAGKRIYHVSVGAYSRYKKDLPEGLLDFDKNCRVSAVGVRGKFMYWTFDNDWHLFNTFGMTGQWSPIAGNHPCLIFQFEGGAEQMIFNDPRHFGTIKFVEGKQKLLSKINSFGWDPLNDGFVTKWVDFIIDKCSGTTKPIGELLMDQKIFAGVGNYIRAEALYLAKISPWRQAHLLSKDEVASLCQALVSVMNESYKHQGATILTYKDAYGAEGKYSSCFKVYGQKKDPLGNDIKREDMPKPKPQTNSKIMKKKSNTRTIHWCPAIQK